MIVDAILDFFYATTAALFEWLSEALPDPPGFWVDAGSAVNTLGGSIADPIKHFLPFGPTITLAITVTSIMVSLSFVKLTRMVLSLSTGGGGSVG